MFVCLGFHLSGIVREPGSGLFPDQEKVFKASVSFDRYATFIKYYITDENEGQ